MAPITDDVWYRDGLAFACTQCGRCCTGEPGYVWLDDAEIARLAETQGLAPEAFLAAFATRARRGWTLRETANGDCVFYAQGVGCTVYEHRPKQCRTWPFWESNLRTPHAWKLTGQHCPGVDRGDLVPVEEITRRMREIRL